jgi:hypothetical protein
MQGNRSPVIDEVGVPNVTEVPWPKEPPASSSSSDSFDNGSDNGAERQEEGSEAVDPRESSRSYVFGPLTVTVG